jgi:hypothetical protein
VFAFERGAESRAQLEKHLALNRFRNVRGAYRSALGEERASSSCTSGPRRIGPVVADRSRESLGKVRDPPISAAMPALPRVDLGPHSADQDRIEGGEMDALRGAVGLLEDFRRRPICGGGDGTVTACAGQRSSAARFAARLGYGMRRLRTWSGGLFDAVRRALFPGRHQRSSTD